MPTNNLDLEIIITSYNCQFWLKNALETIQQFFLKKTKLKVLLTVVDNASIDETIKMVEKEFKWVNLIKLSENIGFAAANNVVLKNTSARYSMLLNSDIELTSNSKIDKLIKYMENHQEIGIITPRIEFTDGHLDPACHRGEPNPWAALTYMSGLERLLPESSWFGQYHQGYKDLMSIHEIDACSGAAMLVRNIYMKEIGLLDERFFMYAEDLDWCKRFREASHKIIYFPLVTIIHHKNKSGIKSSSQAIARKTRHYFYNTMLQYYDKHYSQHYPNIIRKLIRYFIVIKKGAL